MKILSFLGLALSLNAFAGNEGPTPRPEPPGPAPLRKLLIRCLPENAALFGFELASVRGCNTSPPNPQCWSRIDINILKSANGTWKYDGGTSILPDTSEENKDAGTFDLHYGDGSERLFVSVKGKSSLVDIKLPLEFGSMSEVDTNGVQTNYECELF
jgi:hypothetical protein